MNTTPNIEIYYTEKMVSNAYHLVLLYIYQCTVIKVSVIVSTPDISCWRCMLKIYLLMLSSQVENFTVSFGDGRVLCHLIHHYHPALLPKEMIKLQTMGTLTDDTDNNRSHDNSLTGSFNQDPFATGNFASLNVLSNILILDYHH